MIKIIGNEYFLSLKCITLNIQKGLELSLVTTLSH